MAMTMKIIGYDYTVDENGNVFNLTTKRHLKGSIGLNGYKYYRLTKDGKKKMFYAHRLVAEYFIPNKKNLPVVNHIDGDKLNNKIQNLEWVSYSQNTLYAHTLKRNNVREREYYKGNLPGETWKQIVDFPYSISSLGRVKNNKSQLILKPSCVCGYYKVVLCNNGTKQDFMIHNLMYLNFHNLNKIPSGYVVDHIDGNKLNNAINNLRLITLSENVKSALYITKTNHNLKEISCYKNNVFVKNFRSIKEAARELNLDASTISKVCRGKNKSHGGYTFQYKNL